MCKLLVSLYSSESGFRMTETQWIDKAIVASAVKVVEHYQRRIENFRARLARIEDISNTTHYTEFDIKMKLELVKKISKGAIATDNRLSGES